MAISICAFLLLLYCNIPATLPSAVNRIVNGEAVDIKDYPYAVSVQKTFLQSSSLYYHQCGGVIVSPTAVLTAAHCVAETAYETDTRRFRIQAGSTYLSAGFEAHSVDRIIVHPSYDDDKHEHDFAIIHLTSSLQYKTGIAAISYAPSNYNLDDNSAVVVLGWGRLRVGGPNPDNLQAAVVYIVNQQVCATNYTYVNEVTDSMLCAGTPASATPIKDSCSGDSGGPLVHENILVGLVSWGYSCAQPTYPGVYSRISSVRDWISENI